MIQVNPMFDCCYAGRLLKLALMPWLLVQLSLELKIMLKVQTLRTVINFSSAKIDVLITFFLA